MDLVVKEEYLTDKAKEGLMNLRKSNIDLSDIIGEFLEGFSTLNKTEKVA